MLWLCACLFAAWFGLSVANQFETPFTYRLRKLDIFGLISVWKFFAPRPGIHDHYILIQDCDSTGQLLEWKQLLGPSVRRPQSFVWNPGKWESKAIADLLQLVAQANSFGRLDNRTLMLTSPYLVILHFVLGQPCGPEVVARRFALVQKTGRFGKVELSMASDFHPLLSR